MRRLASLLGSVLVASSCMGGGSSEGTTRTVAVDFSHDEFASYYWRFFPSSVEAHPGDTVLFRQEFTGEPHTVTLGTVVQKALAELEALEPDIDELEAQASPDPDAVAAAEERYDAAVDQVPGATSFGEVQQNWAQPCYLETGTPPSAPDEACAPEQQRQPAFDGTQSFYSSGYIAPEGTSGNTFRVELAEDIEPGRYAFVCTIHMPFMAGELNVKPEDAPVASPAETNRRARDEIEKLATPLRRSYAQAKRGRATTGDDRIPLPMGGYHAGDEFTVGIAEFIPRTITTRIGEPVTWTLVGAHTVSFDVPRFLPIFLIDEDGTVRRNPKVSAPAGGSPRPPPLDFESGEVVEIDGGTWDGSGYFSSGLIGSEPFSRYTLRFSKSGRYRYACVIHPKMVGTVVVGT